MRDCSLKEKKRGKKKWVKGLDNSGNIEGFFTGFDHRAGHLASMRP